jgi:chemotaxis protein methyltransferase CheR
MEISSSHVEYIFDYVEKLCGIALDDSKKYLIDARLNPLVKQFGVSSPVELVDKAKMAGGDPIRRSLIEAMTTRETFFFRDNSPFEALQFKAVPELIDVKVKERKQSIRIWSAAASTGQEACSIGIILHEMIPDIQRWDIQILATDISEDALAKGRSGIYTKLEVDRGLPPNYVKKYFTPVKDAYRVADSVHRMIRFQQLNLLDSFKFANKFDIVFCRNVAIYFEKSVKIDLFRRMLPLMPSNGYLFVGVSESLFDCGPEFKPQYHCKSTFYQPNMLGLRPGALNNPAPADPRDRGIDVSTLPSKAAVSRPISVAPTGFKSTGSSAIPGFKPNR